MNRTATCLALALGACTPPIEPLAADQHGQLTNGLDALVAAAPEVPWHYDVTRDGASLRVELSIRDAKSENLNVDGPAGSYVRDLEILKGNAWVEIDNVACGKACRMRYRFALEEAAGDIADTEIAAVAGDTIVSPPSAWLLRPNDEDVPLVFRVNERPDEFVSGLWPHESITGAYVGDSTLFWHAPYSAFGVFHTQALRVGDATVEIAIAGEMTTERRDKALEWVTNAAESVSTYYGRFPVPRVLVVVVPTEGDRIHGKELGGGGASILLSLGEDVTDQRLHNDWIATHEMVHLAVPFMPARHDWLTEGLATYVEPLARAQAGHVLTDVVWRDMILGMPQGQPESGDRGIDRTPTWGRTYWGGAMFALVADVEIRKRTGGKESLQTALRKVVAGGGHNGVVWPIDRFLAAADKASGTKVLSELYAAWAKRPVTVDLDALWRELGVRLHDRAVYVDDEAPHASIRHALTKRVD